MAISGRFYYYGISKKCFIWCYEKNISKLYIHKWRVPEPFPKTILVTLKFKNEFEAEKTRAEYEFTNNPKMKNEPIIRFVHRVSYHSKTVRFDTERYERPFDSIYIPNHFLKGTVDVKLVQVIIKWDSYRQ